MGKLRPDRRDVYRITTAVQPRGEEDGEGEAVEAGEVSAIYDARRRVSSFAEYEALP
jgi:hypothetical protein